MTPRVVPAASALADIGHLLESVEAPSQQLERALVILGRFVPYDRCALFDALSGSTPKLVVLPPTSADEHAAWERKLTTLYHLISDRPMHPPGPLSVPERREGVAHLAFPLIALDDSIGVLMVERQGGDYEEQHLQLLSVVAAQLGGYLANVRLKSEERRATSAMERAADLLEHIQDGFLELDSSWTCVSANGAAVALLEMGHEELVGTDVRAVADLGGKPSFSSACERAMRERVRVQIEAEHYGRQDRWLELELYPTGLGVSVFLRDVTERRAAEQFRELLMGIIGHDLRTPLSAVSYSATTLLRRGGLDEPAVQAIARIASSAARMSEMISQLVDLTRIRFEKGLPLQRREADLGEVCSEVVSEISAAQPGRDIRCEASGDLRGAWDAARLSQAMTNLVANAVQHGDPAAPVRVSARPDEDGGVRLEVHNQGAPIPSELLPTIFHPFRQASSTGVKTGSLGLGLFIAQSIVRAHGGTIEVKSTLEGGTTFSIRLPRRR